MWKHSDEHLDVTNSQNFPSSFVCFRYLWLVYQFLAVDFRARVIVFDFVPGVTSYCMHLFVACFLFFQSRMKSVIVSAGPEVNPFSDTAKRTEFLPFYGSFPNIASKPVAPLMLAKYNSNAGSVESSFKGELLSKYFQFTLPLFPST